jgi:molybdate transport system substrate-binding protein
MAGIRAFSMTVLVMSVLVGVVATGARVQAEALTVGAAPSLKAAFQEIVPMFEKEYGATIDVMYGPSQTLRRQIEKEAPIDLFFPGAAEEVEALHKKGLTLNGGPRIYAQTSLVLVMSAASAATAISFHDVLPNRTIRIAVADPKTSALGTITARTLTKLDPAYKNRFQILYAQHTDEILNLVRTGQADMGVVYRVDAINGGQIRIVDEAIGGAYTPVQFGQAVVWTCRQASLEVAEEFFDFILSPRIQKLLMKYGFDSAPLNGVSSIAQKP